MGLPILRQLKINVTSFQVCFLDSYSESKDPSENSQIIKSVGQQILQLLSFEFLSLCYSLYCKSLFLTRWAHERKRRGSCTKFGAGLGANLSTAAACLDSLSHTYCRSHFSWSVHQDTPSLEMTGNSDWKRLQWRLNWWSGVLKESNIHNMSYRSCSTIVACSPACFLLQRNRVPCFLCPFLSIFFHGAFPLAAIDQQWATICFTHSKSQGVFVWK